MGGVAAGDDSAKQRVYSSSPPAHELRGRDVSIATGRWLIIPGRCRLDSGSSVNHGRQTIGLGNENLISAIVLAD